MIQWLRLDAIQQETQKVEAIEPAKYRAFRYFAVEQNLNAFKVNSFVTSCDHMFLFCQAKLQEMMHSTPDYNPNYWPGVGVDPIVGLIVQKCQLDNLVKKLAD